LNANHTDKFGFAQAIDGQIAENGEVGNLDNAQDDRGEDELYGAFERGDHTLASLNSRTNMSEFSKYHTMFRVCQEICISSKDLNQKQYDYRLAQLLKIQSLWQNGKEFTIVAIDDKEQSSDEDDTTSSQHYYNGSPFITNPSQVYTNLTKGSVAAGQTTIKRQSADKILSQYSSSTNMSTESPQKKKRKLTSQPSSHSIFLPNDNEIEFEDFTE
jgi:hypothetical protein